MLKEGTNSGENRREERRGEERLVSWVKEKK